MGWLGGCVVEEPFVTVSQIATAFYFFYLIIILYYINVIEIILVEELYREFENNRPLEVDVKSPLVGFKYYKTGQVTPRH